MRNFLDRIKSTVTDAQVKRKESPTRPAMNQKKLLDKLIERSQATSKGIHRRTNTSGFSRNFDYWNSKSHVDEAIEVLKNEQTVKFTPKLSEKVSPEVSPDPDTKRSAKVLRSVSL